MPGQVEKVIMLWNPAWEGLTKAPEFRVDSSRVEFVIKTQSRKFEFRVEAPLIN